VRTFEVEWRIDGTQNVIVAIIPDKVRVERDKE